MYAHAYTASRTRTYILAVFVLPYSLALLSQLSGLDKGNRNDYLYLIH